MGPAAPAFPQRHLAGGSRRPQSLIKCLIVSCGASVWDWDMGTISQMDTYLRPVTTAQAILDTAEQEAEIPSNPQTQCHLGTWGATVPLSAATSAPSQNIWEALAGTCASHPATLICVDSDCVATRVCVCAPSVTPSHGCQLSLSPPAALFACPPLPGLL